MTNTFPLYLFGMSTPITRPLIRIRSTFSAVYLFIVCFGCTGSLLLGSFFFSLESGGYSLAAVHRYVISLASLVAEHRLEGSRAPVVATHELGNCSSQPLEHGLCSCGALT